MPRPPPLPAGPLAPSITPPPSFSTPPSERPLATPAAASAVVLAKLVMIDRQHLGSGFGISSFIAYGLLCTAVGYFAPAPPRAAPSLVDRARGHRMKAGAAMD